MTQNQDREEGRSPSPLSQSCVRLRGLLLIVAALLLLAPVVVLAGPKARFLLGAEGIQLSHYAAAAAAAMLAALAVWYAAERCRTSLARHLAAARPQRAGDPHRAGLPCGLAGVHAMVAALEEQRDEVRASEERLRLALIGSGQGFWDWDLSRDRIAYSAGWKRILGFEEAEIGDTVEEWSSRVHPDDLGKARAELRAHLEGRSAVYETVHRMRHKDGGWRWIMDRGSLVRDASGTPVRMVGTHVDVTELTLARLALERQAETLRRLAEERDRARLAAEEASRAKSRFLATVTHELRTPLHGIIGYADLLAEDAASERQKGYVSLQRSAARTLLALVDDILDFSRLEEGRVELERLCLDLPALLAECRALLLPAAAAKGIAVLMEVAPEVPRHVLGDPRRLRQVLVNLLGNAVKFTERGHVALRAAAVPAPGGRVQVRLEVEDTGIGIPADRLDAVFERFAQADAATARRFGGSGLGLAIARSLARAMGGDIVVRSTPGVGSTFGVELPFERAAEPAPEPAPAPAPAPAPEPTLAPAAGPGGAPAAGVPVRPAAPEGAGAEGLRILIADDLDINRKLLADVLRRAGHEVVEAADGSEAVAAWRQGGADLVLMDVRMPAMDGYEATRRIRRADARGAAVPIIGLTADEEGLDTCLAAGMTDVLRKPAPPSEIRKAVERHGPSSRRPPSAGGEAANLIKLRTTLGAENLRLLLEAFVDQAGETAHELGQARHDLEQLQEIAWTLRGTAGMLGFSTLAAACSALVVASRADHPLAADVALEQVLDELGTARREASAFMLPA